MHGLIIYNYLEYLKHKKSDNDNNKRFMGNQKRLYFEAMKKASLVIKIRR